MMGVVARVLRGIGAAVRGRFRVFGLVALAVFVLDVFLPPVVLSVARKPWDVFTFNPWLKRLPEYVASSQVPLEKKLEFLPKMALFWFSADGPFGPEWGFAVTVTDLLRFALTAFLFGAYFALLLYRSGTPGPGRPGLRRGRQGGVLGALLSTIGLSTGPCTVTGCGAPVMPVLGLAFAGLSSGTIAFLSEASKVTTAVLLILMALGVAYLGWAVGQPRR